MFYELTKLPVRRGGFVEFEYAAWATFGDKVRMTARGYQPAPTDLVLADEQGRVLPCNLINNHRMQLPQQGSRIITRGAPAFQMLLNDGTWIRQKDLATPEQWHAAEAVGFARETFAIDESAEIDAAIQGFMQRETLRQVGGWRDPKTGRNAWWRDARGTTLNLQVSSGDRDYYTYSTSFYSSGWIYAGHSTNTCSAGAHFTGLPGTSITINSATLQCNRAYDQNASTRYTRFRMEAAVSPSKCTSQSDFSGRARTTAALSYNQTAPSSGWNSFDLTSVMAEVAALGANTTCNVFHDDNGSSGDGYIAWNSYETLSTLGWKLDIDYTAGGSTPPVQIWQTF